MSKCAAASTYRQRACRLTQAPPRASIEDFEEKALRGGELFGFLAVNAAHQIAQLVFEFLAAQIGELQLRLPLAHHRLEWENIFRQQILVYLLHQPSAPIAWRIGSLELHAFEQQ
jgi:hypothetical protein